MESRDRRTILGNLALLILTLFLSGPENWLRILRGGAGRPKGPPGRPRKPPAPPRLRLEPPAHSVQRHE
jgi:hypothetical protein